MYAPGRKMTLLQRVVYEYMLESGLEPFIISDAAVELRIYPASLMGILKRCQEDKLGDIYKEEFLTYSGSRMKKMFVLYEEGAIELVHRLNLPRWPHTKKSQNR